MSKRYLFVWMFILLFLCLLIPTGTLAAKERIYDEAKLLSDQEKESLEAIAKKHSDKRETDFMIVTITKDIAKDIETYLQDLYDGEELGYDQAYGNVALLGIDIDRRDIIIAGFEKAETQLDGDRIDLIREEITPDLSDSRYADAFEQYIVLSSDYIRYKEGANPNNLLYKTSIQFLAALLFAGSVIGWMVRHTNPRVTTTAATYRDESRTKMNHKRDRYIRKSTTRRLKPQTNNSSSSRRTSTRSSSRIGRTRGGRTHSRSRGKF